ncbi:PqqD family protein [Variovorax ureilyticus]|uniref:PqqD family protein n=1 Tax=Variovorax ureilyticus TaxID=1836198 RepID=A0ABU8V860_9BURK
MSSLSACYRRAPDLRVRPVPELGYCLVFTPDRPKLYTLNAAAWLLLELCDGQDRDALEADFREVYAEQGAGAGDAPDVRFIIEDLEGKGILLRQPTEKEAS